MSGATAAPTAERKPDRLGLRAVSAAVLIPLALGAAWAGGPYFMAFAGVAGIGAWLEWRRLPRGATARAEAVAGCAVVAATLAAFATVGAPWAAAAAAAGATALAAAARGSFRARAFLAGGAALVALALVAMLSLRGAEPAGRAAVFWLFAVVWASDTGAYAAGRVLRGPKLAPRISPHKTWSGAFGGLLLAMGTSVFAGWLIPLSGWVAERPSLALLAGAGALGSLAAQAGDLAESALKRHMGAQDSGSSIPGHGGVLDRLDSLAAAAFAFALAALAGMPLWGP